MNRPAIYLIANLLFSAAVISGVAANPATGVHPLYVILLFAICSTPVIDLTVVNGAYALLAIYSFDYFLMYGALDFVHLISGAVAKSSAWGGLTLSHAGVLSTTEWVILVGGFLAQIGYRLTCRSAVQSARRDRPGDWSEFALVSVGITLWVVCTAVAWKYSVDIIPSATNAAVRHGLARLTSLEISAIMLARMVQPLGILIVAYAQCRYRHAYMGFLVVAVVLFQLYYGFIIDFKTEALLGVVLVLFTKLLIDGKVPKAWLIAVVTLITVAFPVLQANRLVRNEYHENSTTVSENVVKNFRRAFLYRKDVTKGIDRAQTALERLTLKGSVDMIVTKTGILTPFQLGHTLMPMLTAFVPRLIWHGKPNMRAGQIVNRDFHVSASRNTYISISHLGELYWNFGWGGVIIGMSAIGALLGFLGARFNLADGVSITRLMVTVVTVRLLILASEGEFAIQYVLWMRCMLAIGLLHVLLARKSHARSCVAADADARDRSGPSDGRIPADVTAQPYPHLLR